MPPVRDTAQASETAPRSTASSADAHEALRTFLAEHGGGAPVDYSKTRIKSTTKLFARAARRRKLDVSKVHHNYHVITAGGRIVGGFTGPLTSLASDGADSAALSIPRVRGLLARAALPIPEGRSFAPEDLDAGRAWFSALDGPAVIKPGFSQAGVGISRNVANTVAFDEAWVSAVAHRGEAVGADPAVVVERQHTGLDLRVFVVGEEIVAATARVPFYCLGDGHRTVRELVSEAAQRRDAHPLFSEHPYDALAHAEQAGLAMDEVSERSRPYRLGEGIAAPAGGVTVDVTGALGEELQALAVDAVWAVPGCKAAGVDLLVRGLDSAVGAAVLDVDARARISLHHFPWIGRPRFVADAVVRQMAANAHA